MWGGAIGPLSVINQARIESADRYCNVGLLVGRGRAFSVGLAGIALGAALLAAAGPVMRYCEAFGALRFVAALAALAMLGAAVYGGAVAAMLGRRWFDAFGPRTS